MFLGRGNHIRNAGSIQQWRLCLLRLADLALASRQCVDSHHRLVHGIIVNGGARFLGPPPVGVVDQGFRGVGDKRVEGSRESKPTP